MLHGDTRNIPLQNIFQTLDLNQQEGILTVQFQKLERFIAFRPTGISFLTETPWSSRLLQQILGKLRLLTQSEYQNVFSTATADAPPLDVLLYRHLIMPQQVCESIREHFLELVYEVFAWQGVHYRFEVQPMAPERMICSNPEMAAQLEFPVNGVLMEVARREDEWHRIREVIPSAHQIYRFDAAPTEIATISAGLTQLHPEQSQELLELLSGERTLEQLLDEISTPPFFVFTALRSLLLDNHVSPLPLEEKRELADRLRMQLPPEGLANIHRSILEDDSDDLEIRRKLVMFLERNDSPGAELTPHYRRLAMTSIRMGDQSSAREYLRKVLEIEPRDLECLEQLTLLELERKRDREWHLALRSYVEAIRKHREYERGARFLLDMVEARPGEATAIHEAAHLYLLSGKPKDAAATYERAAKLYVGRKDFTRLLNVIEKLEVCDIRAAARWRKHVQGRKQKSLKGKRRSPSKVILSGLGVVALLIAAFCVYEWDARVTYAQVLDDARQRAASGDFDGARSHVDRFRESYNFSVVSRSVAADIAQLEKIANESETSKANSAEAKQQAIKAEADRKMSAASNHQRGGEYQRALEVYQEIDISLLPDAVARRITEQSKFLSEYLAEANEAFQDARKADRARDPERAWSQYVRILDEYPLSPVVHEIRLPLLIDVLPPEARVTVNDVVLEGPPYLLEVPPGQQPKITVTAPSFTPSSIAVDPRDRWQLTIHLQKRTRWSRTLGASVEATPLLLEDRLFAGTRSGKVLCLSALDGTTKWTFELEGLGDTLGGILERADDILFTGTDKALYRVSKDTGKLVYRMPFPEEAGFTRVPMTPPDDAGRSFVTTTTGMMLGVDVDHQRLLWSQRVGGTGTVTPVRIRGLLVTSNSEGRVMALDAVSGTELWGTPLGKPVTATPCGNEEVILVATNHQKVHALSTLNGSELWTASLPAPAVGDFLLENDRCVLVTESGHLIRLNISNGEFDWQTSLESNFRSGPRSMGELVLSVDQRGSVRGHDPVTGSKVWTLSTGSRPSCPLVVAGDYFVIANMNHSFHVVDKGGQTPDETND